jgi:hypothetical protein
MKIGILKEFLGFLAQSKKWWLFPVVIILILLGIILIFAEGSALAPFVYTLF